jgi:predicted signal transduction protein with EAL and GGDEF domain
MVDNNCRFIARSIISLSRSLRLSVIAEGVETREQQESLARMGCHAIQGHLFSPALPLDKFDLWLEKANRTSQNDSPGSPQGTMGSMSTISTSTPPMSGFGFSRTQ